MTSKKKGPPPFYHQWLLPLIFFFSGCAALIFETLWFRLTGLTFGNTVWASALVLSAFMTGLAIGNGLCIKYSNRILYPVRLYALAETIVAAGGVLIVIYLPCLANIFAPVFSLLGGHPLMLNVIRLVLAFTILLIPSTAMGMTLPVLVKALRTSIPGFGQALGRLYGWNTLGAMSGAILSETVLVAKLGILGTGFAAMAINLLAVFTTFFYAQPEKQTVKQGGEKSRATVSGLKTVYPILCAAFLSGFILLAFEVIWFRFMTLFVFGTSLVFAVMLALVLTGIGIGGLLGSSILRIYPGFYKGLPIVSLFTALVSFLTYTCFDPDTVSDMSRFTDTLLFQGTILIFPVSALSGMIFILLGQSMFARMPDDLKSTGYLTVANTIGAAAGSMVAGFVMLPGMGMEISFFILSCLYIPVCLLTLEKNIFKQKKWAVPLVFSFLLIFSAISFFPFGRIDGHMAKPVKKLIDQGMEVILKKEGLNQTLQLLKKDLFGHPFFYKLMTNSYSMSSNRIEARRYMKFYVYLPVALKPDMKSALLISYGVGSTAKAITETKSFEHIDIVDISQDILDQSNILFPEKKENPLNDPRTRVHIEDGRFYLQTTPDTYDLITGEPPPPKGAGIVNLYTQEYFRLIFDRLKKGGIVTYWLPVYQLEESETRAILKAFSLVFPNSSLWTGAGLEWMMVGIKKGLEPVSLKNFSRQWNIPEIFKEMETLGFETPGQLPATLLMDAETIAAYTQSTAPLTDNYPKRLSDVIVTGTLSLKKRYENLMRIDTVYPVYAKSSQMRALFPPAVYAEAAKFFYHQQLINIVFESLKQQTQPIFFEALHHILTTTHPMPSLALFLLHSSRDHINAAGKAAEKENFENPWALYHLACNALVQKKDTEALAYFNHISTRINIHELALLRIYLYCRNGRFDAVFPIWSRLPEKIKQHRDVAAFKKWIHKTYDLDLFW